MEGGSKLQFLLFKTYSSPVAMETFFSVPKAGSPLDDFYDD